MQNIGIIGIGRMAKMYMDVLAQRPQVKVLGALGNTPAKCRAFTEKYRIPVTSGGDFAPWLDSLPGLSAVILCTSEWIRFEPIRLCLERNLPVLTEKPIAVSKTELEKITRISPEKRHLVTVSQSLRYSPRFSAARDAIRSEVIGDLRHVYLRRDQSTESFKRVEGKYQTEFWLSPHDVDLYRWMTGDDFKSVQTFSRPEPYREDSFLISHLTSRQGVHVLHEVSWCAPELAYASRSCEATFRGTRGMIRVNDSDMNVEIFGKEDQHVEPDTYEHFQVGGKYFGLFSAQVDAWLEHLQGGGRGNLATFEEAHRTVEICSAMGDSLRSGTLIHI